MKFIEQHPQIAEEIRDSPTPRAALRTATRLAHSRRPDWFECNIQIMDTVLEAKFTQHPSLRDMLMKTDTRELVEASPVSEYFKDALVLVPTS